MKDLYEIMGVPKNSSDEDIKKSYRQLARQYHPDLNPNNPEAAEKFKEVSTAFEILGNPQKRSEYDNFGFVGGSPFSGRNRPFTSVFEDMFGQFFGEQQRSINKGQNIIVEIPVSIQQVLNGDNIKVRFHRREICEKCEGNGGTLSTCSHCNGSGSKIIRGRNMTVKASCHACNGSGSVIGKSCEHCTGGYVKPTEQSIDFKIFKGVENGMKFIQKNMGEPSLNPNGYPGDLIIVLNVENNKIFDRQPHGDLVLNWPVNYSELVLGAEIDIPTIEGSAKLKVPPGTPVGTRLRLKEMGLPIFNPNDTIYQRGDQFVVLNLDIPKDVNENHKIVIEKLLEEEKENLLNSRKKIINLGGNHGRT